MLRMKNGDLSVSLLKFVGVCGEIPVALLRQWGGYYDYMRRVATRLVREGYLRDRRLEGYHRRVIHSLSLTPKGLELLREVSPQFANVISQHILAPAGGRGDLKHTLRLHRGAWCFLLAVRLRASWAPGKKENAVKEGRLVYFTTYELNRKYGWDNKGVRASGVFFTPQHRFVPVYYLGEHNLYWNGDVENGFRDRLEIAMHSYPYHPGANLFLSKDWSLAENLVRHWVNPNTRMIRPGRSGFSFCLPVDKNGILLAEIVLDESAWVEFLNILKEYGIEPEDYAPNMHCLFELDRLSYFVKRPGTGTLQRPREGYFFPFQMETMKRLNDGGTVLKTIPEAVLEEFSQAE